MRQRRLSAILFIRCKDCDCCTEGRLIAEIGLHICLIAFRLEFVIHLQNFVVCCVAGLCVFCVSGRLCSTSPPGGNQVDGLPPAPVYRNKPQADFEKVSLLEGNFKVNLRSLQNDANRFKNVQNIVV